MPATTLAKRVGRPVDPALRSRRRRQILAAARRAFAQLGFANTDVQLIADAIGVGKGTVYRYFATKEELFLAVADDAMRQLEEHIAAAAEGVEEPERLVRRVGMAYVSFFQRCPEAAEILIQERAAFRGSIPETHMVYREKNRGKFEQVLRQGIQAGLFRPLNVGEAANAFANMLYGTVVCSLLSSSGRKTVRTAQTAVEIFLRGIMKDE